MEKTLKQSAAQWQDFLDRKKDPYAFAKYEILLDWLGPVENNKTLVVGSGSGELAAMLAQRGAQVLAVDIDEASVQLTQKTANEMGVQLQTRCARLEDLTFTNNYDLVLATDVIEHIEDDQKACEQLRNLTRAQGRVVVTVPAMSWLFGYHDEVLGHYRRYSRSQLQNVMLPQGFELLQSRYFGMSLIPVAWLISRVLRRPYPVRQAGEQLQGGGVMGRILSWVFQIEKKLRPPVGTSVLLLARKS